MTSKAFVQPSATSTAVVSGLLFTLTLSGIRLAATTLASSEKLTILGGFVCSLLFFFALMVRNNLKPVSCFMFSFRPLGIWSEKPNGWKVGFFSETTFFFFLFWFYQLILVILCLLVSLVVAATVHPVCITTWFVAEKKVFR